MKSKTKIPTVKETLVVNGSGQVEEIRWKNMIRLRRLENSPNIEIETCLTAHDVLGECISELVRRDVLSPYACGAYSVIEDRKNVGGGKFKERFDLAFDGEFYAFSNLEYANAYLNALGRKNLKVQQWSKLELQVNSKC